MLKILGAGLPRTGTATLAKALQILGYTTLHHDNARLPLYPVNGFTWRAYDDIDAVVDAPASMYWRELYQAYRCKVILTIREPHGWWESIKRHANKIRVGADIEHIHYTEALHSLLFGCAQPCEYWYLRRYIEHSAYVKGTVNTKNLLILDIDGGDKWDVLCPFLKVSEPDVEWPWENRSQ